MERSDAADAWDEGDDGDSYPSAPVPSHERAWRHPSELGQAAWTAAEPPVAIGRGLTVTTGAIGCVLGVAVLWLLTPVGGSLAPSASPVATSSVTTARLAGAPATTAIQAASTTTGSTTGPTLPAEVVPLNTVLVMAFDSDDAPSIAVAIGDTPFIVTTALAVSGVEGVSLMSGGEPTEGVVTIEGDLAYIRPTDAMEVIGFAAVAAAAPGQDLLVLADETVAITFDESGTDLLDADIIVEGTPVIDRNGALVALCTVVIDATGAHVELLPTAGIVDSSEPTASTAVTESTVAAPAETATGWLGVRFLGGTSVDALTITAVAADSPAEHAGLVAGDRITAVDGVGVTTIDAVLQLISSQPPGTSITLTVFGVAPTSTTADPATTTTPSSPSSTTTTVAAVPSTTVVTTTTLASASGGAVERTVSVVLGAFEPTV